MAKNAETHYGLSRPSGRLFLRLLALRVMGGVGPAGLPLTDAADTRPSRLWAVPTPQGSSWPILLTGQGNS